MAGKRPILVLQLQRMGDLVLTFPLLLWLGRRYPGHPIWVAAEERFSRQIVPISPPATYLSWACLRGMLQQPYEIVINLSHRPEAARLAGSVQAEVVVGPVEKDGVTYVRGHFQLYRASLVHNNRHNRFHWADMNALDVIPLAEIAATHFPPPRHLGSGSRSVGLFVGASQPEKRPDPSFFARLADGLVNRGLRPMFFGGPDDADLARQARNLSRSKPPNLAGKFDLPGLAKAGQGLAQFITPDTGPMHLMAWSGVKTLDLSMGPVNPRETAPHASGHAVLQSSLSCVGCWECHAGLNHLCRERFQPGRTATIAHSLVESPAPEALRKQVDFESMRFRGLRLFATGRDEDGLHRLAPLAGQRPAQARELVSLFWHAAFGAHFGLWEHSRLATARRQLAEEFPKLDLALLRALRGLLRELVDYVKHSAASPAPLPTDFWRSRPPCSRPLAGYIQLHVENENASRESLARAVTLVESVLAAWIS
ncbi:MAG: glycosyltransferase family 9 protein [Oceanidesulfovibrio sp.]